MDCRYFEDCSAPMCPKETGAGNTAWFPDEGICRLKGVPEWVKRQRRIAMTGAGETAGYFTLPMLKHHCMVKKGITGIDPDGTGAERKAAEKLWLEKHPVIKPITDEKREKLAAMTEHSMAVRQLK